MPEDTFDTPIRIDIGNSEETSDDDIEAMIRINPDNPLARIAKKLRENKAEIAGSTYMGIYMNWITSKALRLAHSQGAMSFETFKEINELFLPLQSANNIAGTASGMMMVSIANELISGFLQGANKEKWARVSRIAIPILGAVAGAALNVYGETKASFTYDKNDILFGIATIGPSFWAIRTCFASDLKKIKNLGFLAAGKFKRTTDDFNPDSIRIAPAEVEVEEMIRFPNQ